MSSIISGAGPVVGVTVAPSSATPFVFPSSSSVIFIASGVSASKISTSSVGTL